MNSAVTAGTYNYKVVRQFSVMTVVWGIVGMLVGVIIAAQMAWPELNFGVPWLSFGRLRPLHTNAVIFAFGGCALFATSYYVVQRTSQARLWGGPLVAFTFWGWQLVIVAAAVTLPLGITTGKEYAELEWPIDILITLVWVAYALVFFGTIVKRKVKHIYVANWFYGAYIITVAVLHLVNSAEVPASLWKSYSVYPGATDAMVQWWYGHNAVGFFLTAGFLGNHVLLRAEGGGPAHFLVPAVGRALLGADIHLHVGRPASLALHRTARLGAVDRHGLLADPAGSVVGRHDQRHHDLVRCVAQTARRPDPEVPDRLAVVLRHVDVRGADDVDQDRERAQSLHRLDDRARALGRARLGRPGDDRRHLLPAAAPVRSHRDVLAMRLVTTHFWVATIGIVVYIAAMWIAGVMQGLMWRAVNDDGTLTYTFIESVKATYPFYMIRVVGGLLYLAGMVLMAWNMFKTIAAGKAVEAPIPVAVAHA